MTEAARPGEETLFRFIFTQTDLHEFILIRLMLILHSRGCMIQTEEQSGNSVSIHKWLCFGPVPPCVSTADFRIKVRDPLPHFLRRNTRFQVSCTVKRQDTVCSLRDARSLRTTTQALLKLCPASPPTNAAQVFSERSRRAVVNSAPQFQLPNYQVSVPEN